MIYFWVFVSGVALLGFVMSSWILLTKRKDLGYLVFHLSLVSYTFSLFLPLYYGSLGSLSEWPHAEFVYTHAWKVIVVGIFVPVLLFGIYEKLIKKP